MSLVSHGRFFLFGRMELGIHSSMISRNDCFQFNQLDWMSEGSMTLSRSMLIRRSFAFSKSACLECGALGYVSLTPLAHSGQSLLVGRI